MHASQCGSDGEENEQRIDLAYYVLTAVSDMSHICRAHTGQWPLFQTGKMMCLDVACYRDMSDLYNDRRLFIICVTNDFLVVNYSDLCDTYLSPKARAL